VGIGALRDFDDGAFRAAAAVDADDAASTRSPCSTFCISFSGRNRSSPGSSGITKPKPSRWLLTRPAMKPVCVASVKWPGIEIDLAVALHGVQAARQDACASVATFSDFDSAQVERAFGAAEDAENFLRLGMVWVDWFKSFLIILTVLGLAIWHIYAATTAVVYLETP
jgi:hypothetical protein